MPDLGPCHPQPEEVVRKASEREHPQRDLPRQRWTSHQGVRSQQREDHAQSPNQSAGAERRGVICSLPFPVHHTRCGTCDSGPDGQEDDLDRFKPQAKGNRYVVVESQHVVEEVVESLMASGRGEVGPPSSCPGVVDIEQEIATHEGLQFGTAVERFF